MPCDFAGEAADYASEERRGNGVVGRQVILHAECLYVFESSLLENRPQAGADHWGCAGSAECTHNPVERIGGQVDGRFSARRADIEIDGDEHAAGGKVLHMMPNGHDRIREVEEHEAADNRVEWFVGTPAADVALDERYVTLSRGFDALACDGKRLGGPIEPDDRSVGADELSRQTRDVAESRAEIEDALPRCDTGCLEKQAGGRLEPGRLAIQPSQLLRLAAEHVRAFAFGRFRIHFFSLPSCDDRSTSTPLCERTGHIRIGSITRKACDTSPGMALICSAADSTIDFHVADIDQRRTVTARPSILGVVHRTLALVVLSAGLLQAQGPAAPLHGRVVSAESGDPIRNARVKVPNDAGSEPVLTGEDGRFTLASATAGQRSIVAEKTGYAGTTAPASDGVEIRMVKSGAISGRVIDDFGEPMPLITVLAERVITASGPIRMERVAAAETDDRGVYRLSGLPAGEFIVAMAAGPPALARPPQHFYPNAATPDRAQPIAVGSGADVVGIDLVMPLPPAGMIAPRDALPSARPGESASIRGRVARADGLPLRRAQVRLSFSDSLLSRSVTDTDDDGQYEFRGLKSGAYRVTAMSLSFETISFGRHGSRGDAVSVAAGALVDHVDISVPRTSAISGRVLDEYGDPMANANVRVQRIEFSKGRRRLVGVRGIAGRQTNDLGAYRIFGVPPGRYLVSAVVGEAVPGWETADWPGYARTFFQATPVATDAEAVEVSADQDRLNVDIALVRGRTARVAGRALTAAGEPMQGTLWLSPSYRSGAVATAPVSVRAQSDGAFEFTDLPPGEYVIQAATSWVDLATEGEFVATYVIHNGTDVTNVEMRMTPGSTIAGRMTFEGVDPPEASDIELSAVAVDPDLISLADNPVGRAAIRDDWTFELGGLNGPRLLRLLRAPATWALKSILVNGLESADAPLSFGTKDQSLSDVEVVLTHRISEVSGVVTDADGRPVTGAAVIVFPTDRAEWRAHSRFIGHMATGSDGTFALTPLVPSSYFIAAIDPSDYFEADRQFEDPAFLESLAVRATRVTLTDGETRSVSLSVIGG
jgi:protocatechuate 3,4-dioxygenase beta subunit